MDSNDKYIEDYKFIKKYTIINILWTLGEIILLSIYIL